MLRFYPGLSLDALAKMDEDDRWLFTRYIEPLRAKEMWDMRKCLVSVRAKPDDIRDYLTELAEKAFWNDDVTRAAAIESVGRIE